MGPDTEANIGLGDLVGTRTMTRFGRPPQLIGKTIIWVTEKVDLLE